MDYIESTNVNVYPTGFRGINSSNSLTYDPESMLNTEDNITRPYRLMSKGSYVITSEYKESGVFEFVIDGYYFHLKSFKAPKDTCYAHIYVKAKGSTGDATNTAYTANSLSPVEFQTTDQLDDSSGNFIGLIINESSDNANYTGTLLLLENGAVPERSTLKYNRKYIVGGTNYTTYKETGLDKQLDTALIYGSEKTLTLQGKESVTIKAVEENGGANNTITLSNEGTINSTADTEIKNTVSEISTVLAYDGTTNYNYYRVFGNNTEYKQNASTSTISQNASTLQLTGDSNKEVKLSSGGIELTNTSTNSGISLNYNDITEAVLDKSGAKVTYKYNSDETYLELNSVGATLKANTCDISILAASGTITNSADTEIKNTAKTITNTAKNTEKTGSITDEADTITIKGEQEVSIESSIESSNSYIDLDSIKKRVALGVNLNDNYNCSVVLNENADEYFKDEGVYLLAHDGDNDGGICVNESSVYPTVNTYNIGTEDVPFDAGYITTLNSTAVNATTIKAGSVIELDGENAKITSGTFYATSDKRLKENIKDFSYTKSILDLPVKEFNFIGQDKKQIGCIAQDLQKLYPELVETDEKGYLSIAENKLVYLLLEEVKELKKEISELKNSKK